MLVLILFFTAIYFTAIYPFWYWTVHGVFLKPTFYQFNQGMCCFVLFFALAFSSLLQLPLWMHGLGLFYGVVFFGVTGLNWKNTERFPTTLVTAVGLVGCFYALGATVLLLEANFLVCTLQLLGACIFSAAIFSTALGHWYLEMKKLPIQFLLRVVHLFTGFLALRLLIDGVQLLQGSMLNTDGDMVSVMTHLCSFAGLFGWIGLFFGTLFPLGLIFMVRKTLLIGSNTSATGILYVILISIFIGDLAYKFSLLQYGLVL